MIAIGFVGSIVNEIVNKVNCWNSWLLYVSGEGLALLVGKGEVLLRFALAWEAIREGRGIYFGSAGYGNSPFGFRKTATLKHYYAIQI